MIEEYNPIPLKDRKVIDSLVKEVNSKHKSNIITNTPHNLYFQFFFDKELLSQKLKRRLTKKERRLGKESKKYTKEDAIKYLTSLQKLELNGKRYYNYESIRKRKRNKNIKALQKEMNRKGINVTNKVILKIHDNETRTDSFIYYKPAIPKQVKQIESFDGDYFPLTTMVSKRKEYDAEYKKLEKEYYYILSKNPERLEFYINPQLKEESNKRYKRLMKKIKSQTIMVKIKKRMNEIEIEQSELNHAIVVLDNEFYGSEYWYEEFHNRKNKRRIKSKTETKNDFIETFFHNDLCQKGSFNIKKDKQDGIRILGCKLKSCVDKKGENSCDLITQSKFYSKKLFKRNEKTKEIERRM